MKIFSWQIFGLNLVVLLGYFTDRLTKWLAWHKLPTEGVSLIDDVLFLKFSANSGVGFGWAIPAIVRYFLLLIISVFLIDFLIKSYRQRNLFFIFVATLILVSAFSNFWDRLILGYVIDFIAVSFWTVFNLADVGIVLGVIMWLLKICYPNSFARENDPTRVT